MFPIQGSEEGVNNVNYAYPPPIAISNPPPPYGLPPPIPPTTSINNGFEPSYHHMGNHHAYSWPTEVTIHQTTQVIQLRDNSNVYGSPHQQQHYWNQQHYSAPITNPEFPELSTGPRGPPPSWYGSVQPMSTGPNYYGVNEHIAVPPPPPPPLPSTDASASTTIDTVVPVQGTSTTTEARKLENDDRARDRGDRYHDERRDHSRLRRRRSSSPSRRPTRRRSRTRSPERRRRRVDDFKSSRSGGSYARNSVVTTKARVRDSPKTSKHPGKSPNELRRRKSETPRRTPVKELPPKHPQHPSRSQDNHRSKKSTTCPARSHSSSRSRQRERRSSPCKRPLSSQRTSSKPKPSSSHSTSGRNTSTRQQQKQTSHSAETSKKGQSFSSAAPPQVDKQAPAPKDGEPIKSSESDGEEFDETLNVDKWVRSAPAELYYHRDAMEMKATERTKLVCKKFDKNLVERAKKARLEAEELGAAKMKELIDKEADVYGDDDSSTSDSGESSCEDEKSSKPSRTSAANRELERRKLHPRRLHLELWHNDPGLMNDGPVCRCSAKARRFGIRHGFYPGEDIMYGCDPFSNNPTKLFHYRITITPAKNFLVNSPTVIPHDGHEYLFEGFSLFSHYELDLKLPPCKVIRFNIRYDVFIEKEAHPESFCVRELNLFETYLFREILELVDLKQDWEEEMGCSQFHLMPRFVRQLPDNGKEILSMNRILLHLLKHDKELVKEDDLPRLLQVEQKEWQHFADKHKGMIVTKWGMKPCALRVDQIDREIAFDKDGSCNSNEDGIPYPLIVHFGIRPPQLSYAGNSGYQRAWRRYVKYRHLLSNMPKPSIEEKRKLVAKDLKLRQMRTASTMKRDVTVDISSKGFRSTGLCCDIVQHAMLIPVLVGHLRFHKSLATLEKRLQYTFQNPYLLQLAMTHPSYRENFGTNPDHARNALTNCGIRQPEYGDRRIHYSSTRKRGINTLINIMARFGAEDETESEITHNERLEFLGDAVVEFATSIHLFHLFPDLEEGGLATYRAAIVQNQHLAELAQNLQLDQFMLYAHGSDLCHDSELRHAMANCFEALMGAVFLDGGIDVADRIFGRTLFETDPDLYDIWTNYPRHPLQAQEPKGDRHWLLSHGGALKKLTEFEELIGLEFTHIRLLARAFTDRSLGYNHLSRGSNQRLEFLGDTVLQLISSEYLYRHFPDHHEGHLSLLRSSLVNNRTQSLVCDDLGMTNYAMRGDPKVELKTKDRADLLEAFLGALYIDKGLTYCVVFCSVCFIPRLSTSIIKQEWNDPKSKLQQCCLTLRTMDGNEPDIPQYKITESKGPTNTRVYVVAVFFRGERLATAEGHSIQEAEMNAAANALRQSEALFPQLSHQRRIIDKTNKK